MKQVTQLSHAFYNQPLLMPEEDAWVIDNILRRKEAGAFFTGVDLHAELGITMPRSRSALREAPTIAVIPIHGLITHHAASLGTSVDQISSHLDMALASDQIDAILLDVDSPGGGVSGVPELAAKIAEVRKRKRIWAHANGTMASAAYWLSAGTEKIVAARSSLVGSIGVVWAHHDESEALAKEGIRITVLSAGKYKAEGTSWAPLSLDARAHMDKMVQTVYRWFLKAVADGRSTSQTAVENGYGEGRVELGEEARRLKLVDSIGSFDETLIDLAGLVQRAGPRQARAMGLGAAARARRLALDVDPPVS